MHCHNTSQSYFPTAINLVDQTILNSACDSIAASRVPCVYFEKHCYESWIILTVCFLASCCKKINFFQEVDTNAPSNGCSDFTTFFGKQNFSLTAGTISRKEFSNWNRKCDLEEWNKCVFYWLLQDFKSHNPINWTKK